MVELGRSDARAGGNWRATRCVVTPIRRVGVSWGRLAFRGLFRGGPVRQRNGLRGLVIGRVLARGCGRRLCRLAAVGRLSRVIEDGQVIWFVVGFSRIWEGVGLLRR